MFLNKLNNILQSHKSMGLLVLRLFIGARLLYGVVDNVIDWEKMLEFATFLEANHFPIPVFSAIVSVYTQFICSILILIGFNIRIASLVLVFNFIVALVFVHIANSDTIEGMTPAMAMLVISFSLMFTGSGKYSLDHKKQ